MRRRVVSLLWFAVLAVGCAPEPELPVYSTIGRLELETSSGERITVEELDGRVHVVDFIFTSCPMACPMMTSRMKQLYDEHRDAEELRFLSITTDPLHDTVEVLHQYAVERGIDEQRWLFARIDPTEVARLSEKEFLLGAAGFPAGHSLKFVLVDGERRIRGYYDSQSDEEMAALRTDLARLLAGQRRTSREERT